MRLAAIIPDRGDRPKMLDNCLRMMADQTVPPEIFLMNDRPKDERPDITYRYRKGYEIVSRGKFDLVFFIESDDWYHRTYIQTMLSCWIRDGEPEIFGIDYTYYYHLPLRKYFKYGHLGRASMMNTCMKPGLTVRWPHDNYRFTDMLLWGQFQGHTVTPADPISIAMKGHNQGMTGGTGHVNKLFRYVEDDNGFLEKHLDKESFKFYSQL